MSGDDAKSTGWPPVRGPCYLRTLPSVLPADVAAVHDGRRRRGHFVTLAEGQRLFVAQEGEGPDLLLVHGFPSTSHDFAAALPLLGAHFRVTAFDQLGFGFSDKPAGASYSLLDQGRRRVSWRARSASAGPRWWATTWASRSRSRRSAGTRRASSASPSTGSSSATAATWSSSRTSRRSRRI